jgi:stress-induced morphogen
MIERELKDILEKTFMDGIVEVMNDSHLHSGHAGSPGTGQSHFTVLVVSDDFVGQSRVMRHQKINQMTKPLFDKGLHALSIKTYTKDEYKRTP